MNKKNAFFVIAKLLPKQGFIKENNDTSVLVVIENLLEAKD